MCVAIYNKPNVTIEEDVLRNCHRINPDGMGLIAPIDGKLLTHKELKDIDSFCLYYKHLRLNHPDIPIVLHFRLATHGGVSEDMCHPFIVDDDVGFVHNGVIRNVGFEPNKSDTCLFNERMLRQLPDGWQRNTFILDMIADFIGSTNKLIVVDKTGRVVIINEPEGDEDDDGNWFSNSYYKYSSEYKYSYYTGSCSYPYYDKDKKKFSYDKDMYFNSRWDNYYD